MGLRQAVPWALSTLLLLAPAALAAPQEPIVFAVGWDEVDAQFFPHPALCVGDPFTDRQRAAGPGFLFDPDGCADQVEAGLVFVDTDRSRGFSPRDTIYVAPAGAGRVQAGDLRIQTSSPGVVGAADPDAGLTTRPIVSGQWDFVDGDASGRWSRADVAYLDADENGYLSPGDLQIGDGVRVVALDTPGMAFILEATSGGLCYLDDDGSRDWQANEPLYLVVGRPCGYVDEGDLRITQTRGLAAGTRVIEANLDYRNPLMPFEGGAMLGFDPVGERTIIDSDGSGTATNGDRLLAPSLPVLNGTAGEALEPLSEWAFVDVDGTRTASADDLYYVDRDRNGRASIGDVRIGAAFERPLGSVVQDGDVDATAALPDRPVATSAQEQGPFNGTDAGALEEKTPGVGPLLLLPVGMLLWRARRRQA